MSTSGRLVPPYLNGAYPNPEASMSLDSCAAFCMPAQPLTWFCADQGQQVFISYGKQGNDSLMQFYGFLERENPLDAYCINSASRCIQEAAAELGLKTTYASAENDDQVGCVSLGD